MNKPYRISLVIPITITLVGIICALIESTVKSRSLVVFFIIFGIFVIVAFLLWLNSDVSFTDKTIIRRVFIFFKREQRLSDVNKVVLNNKKDNFGGGIPSLTIEFEDKKAFILLGFRKSDLREVLEKIQAVKRIVIESNLKEYLEN